MQLLDVDNAVSYLRERDLVGSNESVEVRELPGGVSNVVLYVARREGGDFVLKQARGQLRVADPWFCSVERIWREVEVLRVCERVLSQQADWEIDATTPRLLFADPDNYLYTMTAVASHETWKDQLLRGTVDTAKSAACGWLLGRLHAGTWHGKELPDSLADRQFFEDLRVDPYYRQVARIAPDLQPKIDELVDSVYAHRQALVHGDFSPKNLLVHSGGIVLIDFEVGHFGDPAFDLGFFLTHLVLKSFHAMPNHARYLQLVERFWESYATPIQTVATDEEWESLCGRAVKNLAGCMLARVDGKSKAEYLAGTTRDRVRDFARELLLDPRGDLMTVAEQARSTLDALARKS
jgi:aminoglycoside phosphotransferase (APT) family kinase protein